MLKGVEDQQAQEPLPRELISLKATTAELLAAAAARQKEKSLTLIDEVESGWKRANSLQLQLSAQGGHRDVLVELADALNDAQTARGRALALNSGMTPQYS